MARLIKNIDSRRHGSLKAGRLLNEIMSAEEISSLIASGHAESTGDDESYASQDKTAGDASGAAVLDIERMLSQSFKMGYASAINDAVDDGLISTEEAGTCIFNIDDGVDDTDQSITDGEIKIGSEDTTAAVGGDDGAGTKKDTKKKTETKKG